jgi:hypothetical protein
MRLRLSIGMALMCAASPAAADRRLFTWTYEYKTVPQGQTAIELWHTQTRSMWDSSDAGAGTALEQILEIEHGLTDHWDAALYTVFTQLASDDPMIASQPFSFHELKLETRYRFADRGEWPVDLLVYGEVAKEFGAGVYEVETKAIFARDFDLVTAAVNLISEVEFGPDVPETEVELGWAAGITYELHPKLNIGVETYGVVEVEESEVLAAVGPAISVAPSSNLWVTVTTAFGFDEAPAFSARMILGIEL